MSVVLCDPETWPCRPFLAIRRKNSEVRGTLLHTHGQPRHVIHAPCEEVRKLVEAGGDPLTELPGSIEMTCADVDMDWEADPDQNGCCAG